MNKYPYSAGHLMAVPYRKVSEMTELTDDEVLEALASLHSCPALAQRMRQGSGI